MGWESQRSHNKLYFSRCTGVHVWPLLFDAPAEAKQGKRHLVKLAMQKEATAAEAEAESSRPVETVWGVGGLESVAAQERQRLKVRLHYRAISRDYLPRQPAGSACRDKTAGIILKSVYTSAGSACRD
jgi:hypothetical protein